MGELILKVDDVGETEKRLVFLTTGAAFGVPGEVSRLTAAGIAGSDPHSAKINGGVI